MTTLVDVLVRSYKQTPDRVAIHLMEGDVDHSISYRVLLHGAEDMHRRWRKLAWARVSL